MKSRNLAAAILSAAIACFVFLPPLIAAPTALLLGILIIRWLPRMTAQFEDEQRARSDVALPLVLDVLSLGLDAGISWDRAVMLSASCADAPLMDELGTAGGRLALGAASEEVWQGSGSLRTIGIVVDRSYRSGSAVSVLLRQQADALRAATRMQRIERVRRLETSILLPLTGLGVPGFMVLGVVPMVASTFLNIQVPGFSTGGS